MEEKKELESPPNELGLYGTGAIKPQARLLHDPAVTFEEYHYYALKTREAERYLEAPRLNLLEMLSRKKQDADDIANVDPNAYAAQHHTETNFSSKEARMQISDEEWKNASRAFRTAGWGACFYLITTDILGPYSIGFGIATLGWGPGIVIFTVFAAFAAYSGYLVYRVFLGLDSYEFPLRNYGDLAFRTWGTIARHVVNFIQALALLLLLGQVTIQFGQNISSMSKFKLCYVVCPLLFVIAGFFLNQIRTLRNVGWLANFSVWLNLLAIFLTMGFIANSPPNYAIATLGSAGFATGGVGGTSIAKMPNGKYPPVAHTTGIPPDGLVGGVNGILAGVLAYAGVQLFVEFLAEMRRPADFLKALLLSQAFIYTVYLTYGSFVYYYQGQYSFSPSYQGVSVYAWQTVGNAVTLVGALIAAALYGNIGIKVLYNNVLMDLFNAPPLITRTGKLFYAAIVPVWWTTAFIIAASIPDFVGFVSVVSASCLLNLTYTIPPFLAVAYDVQKIAIMPGQGFDPATGQVVRESSLIRRWWKGFKSGGLLRMCLNVFHILYFLASLAMCGLGMYAAIEGLITTFAAAGVPTSFSCRSPLDIAGETNGAT